MRTFPKLTLQLPDYLLPELPAENEAISSADARMELVIKLSRVNIENGGGPFAAGIFCMDSHTLLAPGVNLVVPTNCSVAHAEMIAIMFAEQVAESFNLADKGSYELITSSEPCAQCFGAIPWSGVKRVVFGATRFDVEKIGFEEGPKPEKWEAALESRGIHVEGPRLQAKAAQVLLDYLEAGNAIYNGGDVPK